jgi:hypothetical protein
LQARAEALNTAAGATEATQLTSSTAEVVTPAPGHSRHRTRCAPAGALPLIQKERPRNASSRSGT